MIDIRGIFNDYFKMHPHYILVFEGPRGAGKTKQAKLFCEWLGNQVNQPVMYLQSPLRITPFSKSVYDAITAPDKTDEEYALLGILNKSLIQDYIIQHPNTIFVLDRWDLSFWVYQIQVPRLDKNTPFCLWALTYPDRVKPNFQFLLDADFDILQSRGKKIKENFNRYEALEYFHKSVSAYHEYAKVVDCMQVIDTSADTVENTQSLIQEIFCNHLTGGIGGE